MTTPLLKIENLSATVGGKKVLQGLSLTLNAGEVHAIMGPNGSGKSTLSYVLAGRPNPTRYDVMQPGVVTTAEVQREIVRDLRRSGTELVVRWLSPVAAQPEPNGAGRSSGVRTLDRYLARRYLEVERFGDYALLRAQRIDAGPR